ncbi:hypothetical protein CDL12_28695 [Handroanthus impetiginosus]|uniref:BURP domain-containing protein n=1 Tax=Handroanthus impetiginosus TaxID=429701 RepID=A0A2G9G0I8_9LAMI|nr:hypothetical protein CDL12_28695 [Handroanthus impetiginosus]
MELKFQCILAFLYLALVASHGALPSENYWNSVLPNSPMPKAVKDILHPVPGGVTVGALTEKGKLVHDQNQFTYTYAATETQLHDNPNVALFFLEKDLHLGKKMNLQFSKTTNEATFLPRQVADSIPFSSNKLPDILDKFSAKPGSEGAAVIEKTIKECEEKGIKGEEKFCATSLESMVDFSISKLGEDVDAISTNAEEGKK